jgi:hypothetical protein
MGRVHERGRLHERQHERSRSSSSVGLAPNIGTKHSELAYTLDAPGWSYSVVGLRYRVFFRASVAGDEWQG